jgi:hypothetical protein
MAKPNLIEIHVQAPTEVAAVTADQLMRAAKDKGYVVRMGKTMEEIKSGDGWFAIDYGTREREQAEAEIVELISGINGGPDMLSVGSNGGRGYDWVLQGN